MEVNVSKQYIENMNTSFRSFLLPLLEKGRVDNVLYRAQVGLRENKINPDELRLLLSSLAGQQVIFPSHFFEYEFRAECLGFLRELSIPFVLQLSPGAELEKYRQEVEALAQTEPSLFLGVEIVMDRPYHVADQKILGSWEQRGLVWRYVFCPVIEISAVKSLEKLPANLLQRLYFTFPKKTDRWDSFYSADEATLFLTEIKGVMAGNSARVLEYKVVTIPEVKSEIEAREQVVSAPSINPERSDRSFWRVLFFPILFIPYLVLSLLHNPVAVAQTFGLWLKRGYYFLHKCVLGVFYFLRHCVITIYYCLRNDSVSRYYRIRVLTIKIYYQLRHYGISAFFFLKNHLFLFALRLRALAIATYYFFRYQPYNLLIFLIYTLPHKIHMGALFSFYYLKRQIHLGSIAAFYYLKRKIHLGAIGLYYFLRYLPQRVWHFFMYSAPNKNHGRALGVMYLPRHFLAMLPVYLARLRSLVVIFYFHCRHWILTAYFWLRHPLWNTEQSFPHFHRLFFYPFLKAYWFIKFQIQKRILRRLESEG